MLYHKDEVQNFLCTPDPDFDNKCLLSDVRKCPYTPLDFKFSTLRVTNERK